jgi:hypothetical protein
VKFSSLGSLLGPTQRQPHEYSDTNEVGGVVEIGRLVISCVVQKKKQEKEK